MPIYMYNHVHTFKSAFPLVSFLSWSSSSTICDLKWIRYHFPAYFCIEHCTNFRQYLKELTNVRQRKLRPSMCSPSLTLSLSISEQLSASSTICDLKCLCYNFPAYVCIESCTNMHQGMHIFVHTFMKALFSTLDPLSLFLWQCSILCDEEFLCYQFPIST